MASDYVFHIRNAHPGDIAAVLATLDEFPGLETIAEVIDQADKLGFAIRDRQRLEALMTARDLGLVDKEKNELSKRGHALSRLETRKPEIFADVVHGLLYTLWDSRDPGTNCFSWSYRTVCQALWNSGSVLISRRRDLASSVESQARTAFGRPNIVFSPKSIGGALLWLTELDPSVLDGDEMRFARRSFCPPELFALAVGFAYQMEGVDYGTNLLLNDERRDVICQVCLLESDGFDRVSEYAVAQFDYLDKGLGGGWGHYLNLQHAPQLEGFE